MPSRYREQKEEENFMSTETKTSTRQAAKESRAFERKSFKRRVLRFFGVMNYRKFCKPTSLVCKTAQNVAVMDKSFLRRKHDLSCLTALLRYCPLNHRLPNITGENIGNAVFSVPYVFYFLTPRCIAFTISTSGMMAADSPRETISSLAVSGSREKMPASTGT